MLSQPTPAAPESPAPGASADIVCLPTDGRQLRANDPPPSSSFSVPCSLVLRGLSQLMSYPSHRSNGLVGGNCKLRDINQRVKRLTATGDSGQHENGDRLFCSLFPIPCSLFPGSWF